jgi:hypothetical protein
VQNAGLPVFRHLGLRSGVQSVPRLAGLLGQASEIVSKSLSERKTWQDILCPGNKLPGYYPASLRDDMDLSPVGAIDSSPVLQRRAKMVAGFRTPRKVFETVPDARPTEEEIALGLRYCNDSHILFLANSSERLFLSTWYNGC